jgi:phosphoserine aminotransferase
MTPETANTDAHRDPAVPEIPTSLRPSDGRFGSGPSKVLPAAVTALADVAPAFLGTSHRQATVKNVVGNVRDGISSLLGLPDDYEVLLGNGGATAFWDAATFHLIERRSRHLVFGEFSSKFASAADAAPHLDTPDVVRSDPGTHPAVTATGDGGAVDLVALTHNETSTGVALPVARPPDGDAIVAVDATSAAGGMAVDPAEYDVYYFSPQKCFGADGGLWLAACSPAGVDRIRSLSASERWCPAFLDLGTALENSRKNQTYNTPALGTVAILAATLDWMLDNGGMDFTAGRCARSAGHVYDWAERRTWATPFVTDAAMRSTTVTTVDFDDAVDASTIASVLRANGIIDVEPYRKLGRNQLRIATFPIIEPDDIERLTGCIDWIVESGVADRTAGRPGEAP